MVCADLAVYSRPSTIRSPRIHSGALAYRTLHHGNSCWLVSAGSWFDHRVARGPFMETLAHGQSSDSLARFGPGFLVGNQRLHQIAFSY